MMEEVRIHYVDYNHGYFNWMTTLESRLSDTQTARGTPGKFCRTTDGEKN